MISIEFDKKGKEIIANSEIMATVIKHVDDNYYDNVEKQNGKRFDASDNKITFTLYNLNGGEAKAKSIGTEISNKLANDNKGCAFNIKFQCITIGSTHKMQFVVYKPVSEALKFAPADNGAVAASVKLPKDKISEFLSDVASKFNLKKFKKYGTEFWSQSSGEANSKYYITKTLSNNLYAFINTKFDSSFHKDIEAFKEYLEEKIKSYAPAPVEEEEVIVMDKIPAAPAAPAATQDQMTIPMFKNESKFLKEDAVVNLDEMKEMFGNSVIYNILLEATNGGASINTLKSDNGLTYRTKIVNEDKFILEEHDIQPEDIINDGITGLDELIEDEIEPGDEVITKDLHVMYYIGLSNGAGVLVSPSLNAVKVMLNGMGEPDQEDEDEAIVECAYNQISHFNEAVKSDHDGPAKINNDGDVDMEISFDGALMTAYFTSNDGIKKGVNKFGGDFKKLVDNKTVLPKSKLPELKAWAEKQNITYKINESVEPETLEKMLKAKGWVKDGDFYKWDKFSTTTEEYLISINEKDGLYKFVYDPIITDDDRQVKTSRDFSMEDYSDIILPSTMDEFDHVMKLKSDDLYKKGTTVEYKSKKVKIKKYNFGKYVVKVDGKDEEVDAKDLKPVTESKNNYKRYTLKEGKDAWVFDAADFKDCKPEEIKAEALRARKVWDATPAGPLKDKVGKFLDDIKAHYNKLDESFNVQGFEEHYTKAEIKKFLEDNGVEHDGEDKWWTIEMEKDKGASANDAFLIIQEYGGDKLAKKWKSSRSDQIMV